ncbi:MAG TPA: S8 family serine peptidase, partial [Bacteroidales bacterium]|nr:S8 family serine peptidase [Bacteroidales bacterium]
SEVGSSEYPIEEFNWAVAAELADSIGADIITSSLGYSVFDDASMDHTYRDMNGHSTMASQAASIAASKGIIVLVSAGNEGEDNWKYITAPSDADSILTVGAINSLGVRAPFSSVGPTFDRRIKPDVMAVGWNTVVQTPGNTIATANGTSFSAPIIAGLTACLWQSAPGKKNIDIINAIKQSSSRYQTPDSLMGYGIPDFYKAYATLHPLRDKDINAWPSPFTSELNVAFAPIAEKSARLSIYTVSGRKVFEKHISTISTDTNTVVIDELAYLQKGLYVVKVFAGSQVFVCKVVKL